ncbi:unnamed protein product [Wickerhamomyces anomalus]
MSPSKGQSGTKPRSSPREGRKSSESATSPSTHTSKTSAGKETETAESSPIKKPTSSSSASSITGASSSGIKGFSKFLRSHKRQKSLDPSELGSTSERREAQDLQRSGSRSRSKSPLKSTIHEEEETEKQQKQKPVEQEELRGIPKDSNPITESYLKDTLGISLKDWPYSEQLLISTISLKAEKEKTKKESLRLSYVQSSIDLVKLSVNSGIPPHLIPCVFVSSAQSKEILEKYGLKESTPDAPQQHPQQQHEQPVQQPSRRPSETQLQSKPTGQSQQPKNLQTSTSVFKVNIPQQTQFQFHHWQKPGESLSQQQPQPQQDSEKKRKLSDEPLRPPQQQPSLKPSTPTRFSTSSSSHRRNQSEASVSQLRSLYETQIMQHQQHQQQQHQQQQQQQWGRTLGSPYYPSREPARPLYFQYPQQQVPIPQQQQQQQHHAPPPQPYAYPVQYIQGPPPQQGPPQGFAFPPRPIQNPQGRETPVQQILPPPPQIGSTGVHSLPGPGPPPPPSQYREGESMSVSGSPIAMKRGSGEQSKQGKSDVSFLISTPNNPPNK